MIVFSFQSIEAVLVSWDLDLEPLGWVDSGTNCEIQMKKVGKKIRSSLLGCIWTKYPQAIHCQL